MCTNMSGMYGNTGFPGAPVHFNYMCTLNQILSILLTCVNTIL